MRKKTKKISIAVVIVAVIILALMLSGNEKVKTSVVGTSIYDSFAQCISDSGAEMFGAFWCPTCNDQKSVFGSSQDNIPYIECSLQNRSQTIACRKEGIESYPTWRFADGTEKIGLLSLEELEHVRAVHSLLNIKCQ